MVSAPISDGHCSRSLVPSPAPGGDTAGRRGVLLVLSGTSGAGKGTLGAQLRSTEPQLHWSVSWTTRPPRVGERDGVDYRFVSRAEFERVRDDGGFLE